MKKLIAIAVLAVMVMGFGAEAFAYGIHRVNGHFRSNGTYVNSYLRSNPNNTTYDNLGNLGW